MSHQTSRKLKNSKLSEVVAYDGGFTAQGSNVESLLNSTSVHKDVSQVSVTSGSANINSGAMTVPGNSIIKSCTVIALEDLDEDYVHTREGVRVTPDQLRELLPILKELLDTIDNIEEEEERNK